MTRADLHRAAELLRRVTPRSPDEAADTERLVALFERT